MTQPPGLVAEITGQDAKDSTTGKAAQTLLAHAKQDRALRTPDVTDWLKRTTRQPTNATRLCMR